MTETLAEKICTLCRGGVPGLTRDEAQRLQAEASNWGLVTMPIASSARFDSTIFGNHSPLFRKSVSDVNRTAETAPTGAGDSEPRRP
jgi:hypothetical protein